MAALCGLFYGSNKMATDVEVQFFSHLNGLTLGNNWGDLIRLLDKALVTGLDFTQITAASIDAQGDVHISLYAAHNAMLFQVVELSGFTPTSLNQKYRIKGVPNATQLILKPAIDIAERSVTTIGAGKLASLGYEIIFRDTDDVKRVYRAKNPLAKHPFIRVDESIASDTGTYNSTYSKYAMVGLLENMSHIDDFENPSVFQLPFDTSNVGKNWKITGSGNSCVRGWSRWYYATLYDIADFFQDKYVPTNGGRYFALTGDADAFYFSVGSTYKERYVNLHGCGLYDSPADSITPNWFLMTHLTAHAISATPYVSTLEGSQALRASDIASRFFVLKDGAITPANTQKANPILPDLFSGYSNLYNGQTISALQIPFSDLDRKLRGSLKHIHYAGQSKGAVQGMPLIAENSMYMYCNCVASSNTQCGFYYYLGEIE